MTPEPPVSPPPASRSNRPWVVVVLGLTTLAIAAVLFAFYRMSNLPGAALDKGSAMIKEFGRQAATVAGAFRQRNVREEFMSSSVTLTGTKRLQVATLTEHETFRRKERDSAVWGWIALPEIVVQADVPVEYTFYLDFEAAWQFDLKDDDVIVHAPPILPNTPAPDISKLTFYTLEGHIWQDDKSVRDRLQGSLSAALHERAVEHVPMVREIARQQVESFVEKWLARSFSDGQAFRVKVIFPEEKDELPPPGEKGGK